MSRSLIRHPAESSDLIEDPYIQHEVTLADLDDRLVILVHAFRAFAISVADSFPSLCGDVDQFLASIVDVPTLDLSEVPS